MADWAPPGSSNDIIRQMSRLPKGSYKIPRLAKLLPWSRMTQTQKIAATALLLLNSQYRKRTNRKVAGKV